MKLDNNFAERPTLNNTWIPQNLNKIYYKLNSSIPNNYKAIFLIITIISIATIHFLCDFYEKNVEARTKKLEKLENQLINKYSLVKEKNTEIDRLKIEIHNQEVDLNNKIREIQRLKALVRPEDEFKSLLMSYQSAVRTTSGCGYRGQLDIDEAYAALLNFVKAHPDYKSRLPKEKHLCTYDGMDGLSGALAALGTASKDQ